MAHATTILELHGNLGEEVAKGNGGEPILYQYLMREHVVKNARQVFGPEFIEDGISEELWEEFCQEWQSEFGDDVSLVATQLWGRWDRDAAEERIEERRIEDESS
jgi:hypothetical protein